MPNMRLPTTNISIKQHEQNKDSKARMIKHVWKMLPKGTFFALLSIVAVLFIHSGVDYGYAVTSAFFGVVSESRKLSAAFAAVTQESKTDAIRRYTDDDLAEYKQINKFLRDTQASEQNIADIFEHFLEGQRTVGPLAVGQYVLSDKAFGYGVGERINGAVAGRSNVSHLIASIHNMNAFMRDEQLCIKPMAGETLYRGVVLDIPPPKGMGTAAERANKIKALQTSGAALGLKDDNVYGIGGASFTSTSTNETKAIKFIKRYVRKRNGGNCPAADVPAILYVIANPDRIGCAISAVSTLEQEKEVLLPMGVSIQFDSQQERQIGVTVPEPESAHSVQCTFTRMSVTLLTKPRPQQAPQPQQPPKPQQQAPQTQSPTPNPTYSTDTYDSIDDRLRAW